MKSNTILILFITIFLHSSAIAQIQQRKSGQESIGENRQFKFHDNKEGTSMMPIMGDVLPLVQYIEDTMRLEIVRLEYDLIFPDNSKFSYRTLYKGWKYGIFVIGDYRIKKINIKLYVKENNDWKFYSGSSSNNYIARLNIEPKEMKEYAIEIIANETANGYKAGHYALIIYH
ncbi:MAG: hypothetical protein U0W24_03630 [Bacteroidales bacterium]